MSHSEASGPPQMHATTILMVRKGGRVVIGAVEAAPVLVADANALFGGRIGPDFAERFNAAAADALLRDAGLTDAVARHVHVTVLARAVAQAASHHPTRTVSEAA